MRRRQLTQRELGGGPGRGVWVCVSEAVYLGVTSVWDCLYRSGVCVCVCLPLQTHLSICVSVCAHL